MEELQNQKRELEQKLKDLSNKKDQTAKFTRYSPYTLLKPTDFREKAKKYEQVGSAFQSGMYEERKKQNIERLKQEVQKAEETNCTFQPQVITAKTPEAYVPIFERPLPQKQAAKEGQDEQKEKQVKANVAQPDESTVKRFEEFYKKNLEWKKANEEKALQERLDKEIKELNKTKIGPKVNEEKNRELFKKESEFMDRVQADMQRTKEKKEKLEEKYYGNTFKPKINRNIPVNSVVTERLKRPQGEQDED